MLLFGKLVDETQMGNPRDHAVRDIASKFSIFLPLRAIYFRSYQYETPCTTEYLGYQEENGCTMEQSGETNCYFNFVAGCNGATGKWISTFLMILLFSTMRM